MMGQSIHLVLEEFPFDESESSPFPVRRQWPKPVPPPQPAKPAPDLLAEAYARGYEEGQAVTRVAMEMELATVKDELNQRLELVTSRFSERIADQLSDCLRARLEELQAEIASQIAVALIPVISYALSEASLRELVDQLRLITADSQNVTIELSGPQDLLDAIWQRYCEKGSAVSIEGPSVKFVADEISDVRVTVKDAVIEMRLKDWISRLTEAIR